MNVMGGLGERGAPTPLPGVENLMLHFVADSEGWSKVPVIVSDREVLSRIAQITDYALTELERRVGASTHHGDGQA